MGNTDTLNEPRKKFFSIWKPQGKLCNKRPFLVNAHPPSPLSSSGRERIEKQGSKCHV